MQNRCLRALRKLIYISRTVHLACEILRENGKRDFAERIMQEYVTEVEQHKKMSSESGLCWTVKNSLSHLKYMDIKR